MAYTIKTVFTASYDGLRNTIKAVQSQFNTMKADANRFATDFEADMEKAGGSAEILNKAVTSSAIAVATLTVPLTLAGKGALTMAGQFEASVQTLEYTLGDAKQIVDDFVEHNAQSLGMAEQDAYKFANVYSNLVTTMTDDQKTNAVMTNKLLQASAVIMTKTGRTFYDVADRIRSGLLGNTEAIEDLGVNVNVALLETTDAFKQIAGDKSWDTLSFQEQQQVRLLGILEQTSKKYGEEVGDNLSLELSQAAAMFQNVKTEASKFLAVGLQPLLNGIKGVLENIAVFVKYLNTLDEGTKRSVANFLVFIAVVPAVALVFTTVIKVINSYLLFTKLASASTVGLAKSMLSLVGTALLLLSGILMLAYAFGAFDKSKTSVEKSVKPTVTAGKAIDNLSNSQNANAESAEKAAEANKKLADNLQSFDEINKLQLDSTTGNIDSIGTPAVDLSGIDTGVFDNIDTQVGSLNDKVEEFKNNLEGLKPIIGTVGSFILGSKLFQGLKNIGKIIPKFKGLFTGLAGVLGASGIAGAFESVGIWAMYAAEGLTGLSLGVGGSVALLSGVGALIAAAVGAWGYAIYLGCQESLKVVDVFEDVSEGTKEALEPFVDTLENVNKSVIEANFDNIITDEEVEQIKTNLNTVSDEFSNKFVPKYEEARQAILDAPITDFMTEEKKQELLNNMEKTNTATQMLLQDHKNKIIEIVENAKNERGYINSQEQKEIDEHMYAITHLTVSRLTESEEEQKMILTRIAQNREGLDARYYLGLLQRAKESAEEQNKLNEQQYEETLKTARFLYEDLGSITEEEYNKMIEDAKNTYDQMNLEVDNGYQKIVNTTKEKLGENANAINYETLEMKNLFKRALDNIAENISNWWTNDIAPWFTKEKWQEIGNNAINGLKSKYNEFKRNFKPIYNWWQDNIAPWFTWEKWKSLGEDALNGLKNAFSNFKFPSIKMPHFSISYDTNGWGSSAFKLFGLQGTPKINVNWYKKGGVFTNASVIGVGEYPNARINPEVVAPQSMIYEASMEAIKDTQGSGNSNNIARNNNTITKKVELEIDLKSGGVKFGKQIIDVILDANDFYDLGLI